MIDCWRLASYTSLDPQAMYFVYTSLDPQAMYFVWSLAFARNGTPNVSGDDNDTDKPTHRQCERD